MTDPWSVLGVPRGADEATIKAAYRRLALRWHPDRNQGNQEEATRRFTQVAEAYRLLTEPRPEPRPTIMGRRDPEAQAVEINLNVLFEEFVGLFGKTHKRRRP